MLEIPTREDSGLAQWVASAKVPGLTVLFHPDAGRVGETVNPDEGLLQDERAALLGEMGGVLQNALSALSEEDRLILKLRFQDSIKISQIADLLDLPAKWLYRRIQVILGSLRSVLEDEGWNRDRVRPLDWRLEGLQLEYSSPAYAKREQDHDGGEPIRKAA